MVAVVVAKQMAMNKRKLSPKQRRRKKDIAFDKKYKGKRFDIKGNVIGKVRVVSGGKADGNK